MRYLLILLTFLLTSCATLHIKSDPEVKMDKNEEKLRENAAKIIEIAKSNINKLSTSSKVDIENLKDILNELTAAQSSLDFKLADQLKAKEELEKNKEYFNKLSKESNDILNENKQLMDVVADLNNKLITDKIGTDAVKKDHADSRHKWYAIGGSLVILFGMIIYIMPPSITGAIKGLFK